MLSQKGTWKRLARKGHGNGVHENGETEKGTWKGKRGFLNLYHFQHLSPLPLVLFVHYWYWLWLCF